ncbi:alkaline phosphatase family protein, partial [Yinghuangia seranimata]|uniref:alkaline phosphatase family protein n=1 Tax=Yinghuangia seranimata TaxID=408067 RepID=UPI00248AAE6A
NQYRTAAPGNPLYDKARTGTNSKAGEGFFDILRADVKANRLPQVSWIVAPEAFTEHPNWPVNWGAWYTAQVLDALTANPDVWSKTALLITYDENDGFFDHVVPPFAAATPQQGASTVATTGEFYAGQGGAIAGQYGLGQRVPMLVVSPWSTGGWVCSETFDHTSIVRFIEKRFGVQEPNISPWRRAVCGDLTNAFDFGHTEHKVPKLPSTSTYVPADHDRHPDFVPVPPAVGALPKQERGLRPARALPYDLAADAHAGADGRLRLDFDNRGQAGATFLVTSTTHAAGPWTYTVEPRRTLSGTWDVSADPNGLYDFSVHGPNGFMRQAKGKAGVLVADVTARHNGDHQLVEVTLVNESTRTIDLTVTDAYGHRNGNGNDNSQGDNNNQGGNRDSYRLRPGARATHTARLNKSNGWYDLTVACWQDDTFTRRLAGHVENGRPSTSDPATIAAPCPGGARWSSFRGQKPPIHTEDVLGR